jgi:hypothetical protein
MCEFVNLHSHLVGEQGFSGPPEVLNHRAATS